MVSPDVVFVVSVVSGTLVMQRIASTVRFPLVRPTARLT